MSSGIMHVEYHDSFGSNEFCKFIGDKFEAVEDKADHYYLEYNELIAAFDRMSAEFKNDKFNQECCDKMLDIIRKNGDAAEFCIGW